MSENKIADALLKAGKSFWKTLPLILGTILLVSLVATAIPKSFYLELFSKNIIFDSFIGTLIGSISLGTPVSSYIFGGELLKQGVGLIAITSFLVSWVTVGIVQLPAESAILGKKFALLRNLTAFIMAIIVAITTFLIMELI